MSPASGNSNDSDSEQPPLSLERRDSAEPDTENQPLDDSEDFKPIKVSDELTVYSAQSMVRSPLKLIQNIFYNFWAGRELAWRLFLRNIRGLYRQTFLGLFWAFLPPIANTAIWIFLRETGMFNMGEMKVNSTVYILAGMIMWQAFIDAFQMPLGMLNKNRNMIGKLNFPREALLLVGIGEVFFDLMIRMLLLIPAFIIFGVTPHLTILLAPFAIVGLVLLGVSLGLLIMPFGSLYQDVGRFISMTLPFWMIITPVIYPPISEGMGTLLNWVNPASPLLIVGRDWMLIGSTDFLWVGLAYGLATIPLTLLGLMVFRISIPVLVERMSA